jgi:Flp pilus assembly protein TadB
MFLGAAAALASIVALMGASKRRRRRRKELEALLVADARERACETARRQAAVRGYAWPKAGPANVLPKRTVNQNGLGIRKGIARQVRSGRV